VIYILDLNETERAGELSLELAFRDPKADGSPGRLRDLKVKRDALEAFPEASDREIVSLLDGSGDATYGWDGYGYGGYRSYSALPHRHRLSATLAEQLLPRIAATGRCYARRSYGTSEASVELFHLAFDPGPPWSFEVGIEAAKKHYLVTGRLRRGGAELSPGDVLMSTPTMVVTKLAAARIEAHGAADLMALLSREQKLSVPLADGMELMRVLAARPGLSIEPVPQALRLERVIVTPTPRLQVLKPVYRGSQDRVPVTWDFDYDGKTVRGDDPAVAMLDEEGRRLLLRDTTAERAAGDRLRELGFKEVPAYAREGSQPTLETAPKKLPAMVAALLAEGWRVEAQGALYRKAGDISVSVTSGIDWFELHGEATFDGQTVALPELLAALKRGDAMVTLGDGTFGVLPEQWLAKYGALAGLGEASNGHLRFKPTQVALLDALLAAMPQATCDAVFTAARDRLRRFDGVKPADPPASFTGTLRPYQREGLGWLSFLREFRFGGCLADDMGLGKTVQVLAMLEERRVEREAAPPRKNGKTAPNPVAPRTSLAVVPKSLIFNWMQEAARFAPSLRVLDHTGIDRAGTEALAACFAGYDLVLTTYGTLRNDAAHIKDIVFDYVILDEAQAVKNAGTHAAKAARLLDARHRLVMTGTPVENHLGDLWSLFEFLNPGMLGSSSVFRTMGGGKTAAPESRELLAKALRPFILRRKKEQVATDLPAKSEQTIYCEMEPAQQKMYNDLRDHYRQVLLGKIDRDGMNKAKIQVLEALLRLRQAACHPGLIDPKKVKHESAKLDAMLPRIQEVIAEGHKALVFSQFTSFLSIVRDRLSEAGIAYEYLDGQTADRQACVDRFQKDGNCPVFLISLKAGGVGLNLTAAEYVFLLDPWWNPAVEAQAIDRAHRIGQTRNVFAYRMITKGTVEEKVLELQNTKRQLADAIITADNSVLSMLGREELELLLS